MRKYWIPSSEGMTPFCLVNYNHESLSNEKKEL